MSPRKKLPPTGGCWPTTDQEMMLRACLQDGQEALTAWRNWTARTDFDALDSGSLRLVPLLYTNLLRLGAPAEELESYKSVYRQLWGRNQFLFGALRKVLLLLKDSNIPTILLKGAALSLAHYQDRATRPIGDLDVLVPQEEAPRAMKVLQEAAWRPYQPLRAPGKLIELMHGFPFSNTGGAKLDLHWRSVHYVKDAHLDEGPWEGAVRIVLDGAESLRQNPADELVSTFSHGLVNETEPTIRWIADAIVILRGSPSLDWERFLRQSHRAQSTLACRDALSYLQREFSVTVPAPVLGVLSTRPTTAFERRTNQYNQSRHTVWSLKTLRDMAFHVQYYHHCVRSSDDGAWLTGFVRYYTGVWRLTSPWDIPGFCLRRALADLRRHISPSTGIWR